MRTPLERVDLSERFENRVVKDLRKAMFQRSDGSLVFERARPRDPIWFSGLPYDMSIKCYWSKEVALGRLFKPDPQRCKMLQRLFDTQCDRPVFLIAGKSGYPPLVLITASDSYSLSGLHKLDESPAKIEICIDEHTSPGYHGVDMHCFVYPYWVWLNAVYTEVRGDIDEYAPFPGDTGGCVS